MRSKLHVIFSILILAILLSSCFKNETYPIEPIISDPVVVFSGDSAKLTFSFTDGDGDIGLEANDTLAPFNPTSYYHYNLYIDYFEKDDELGWQRGRDLAGDSIVFRYRLLPIFVKGKARGIKGTMDVTIVPFANPFSSQSDTIRYEVKLIDQALHESNVIQTEMIVH